MQLLINPNHIHYQHCYLSQHPIYSCWDKVSVSTGSWDLAHLQIRVFPVITFYQHELELLPSLQVKQGCPDPSH